MIVNHVGSYWQWHEALILDVVNIQLMFQDYPGIYFGCMKKFFVTERKKFDFILENNINI